MPKSASLLVPLFPLPGVVLFPGAVLPLRVFEPRYVKLLNDALNGRRLIAMANIKAEAAPGAETPPLHEILGVGQIVAHREVGDGTHQIALLGQERCKIIEELPHEIYRVARVLPLADRVGSGKSAAVAKAHAELLGVGRKLIERTFEGEARTQFEKTLTGADAGASADLLASIFVQDASLRQALLESIDVVARAQILKAIIGRILSRMDCVPPALKYDHNSICLN